MFKKFHVMYNLQTLNHMCFSESSDTSFDVTFRLNSIIEFIVSKLIDKQILIIFKKTYI